MGNQTSYKKGHRQSTEARLKMSVARRGKEPWNKGLLMSDETKSKISRNRKGKLGGIPFPKGNKPWNKGIGTKTSEVKKLRSSLAYREWRKAVFTRDNYTCQECGKYGGELNADHIKPLAAYIELALDITNGRTLCVPCHRNTPTFGNRSKKHIKDNSATSKWRCIASA